MFRNRFFGSLAPIAWALVASVAGLNTVRAQGDLQYQVANLVQDVRLLDERIRQVTMQMEEVSRENAQLRDLLANYKSQAGQMTQQFATAGQVNKSIQQAVSELQKRDEVIKSEVVLEVTKLIEKQTKKMEDLLNKTVGGTPSSPSPKAPPPMTADVPTGGTPYVVAPGDTLDSIARKLDSRTDWIQKANKIVDPRLLQVGQTLFIPQKTEP